MVWGLSYTVVVSTKFKSKKLSVKMFQIFVFVFHFFTLSFLQIPSHMFCPLLGSERFLICFISIMIIL